MTDKSQGQDIGGAARHASLPKARAIPTKASPRARLSNQMTKVLELMAYEGLSLPHAAQRADMKLESARKAMAKAHTKVAFNQLVAAIRENAGQAAYLRLNHMSQTAQSETVKMEANKWVAGVDGIAALKRVEGKHTVSHTFGGFSYGERDTSTADDAQIIEGSTDNQSGDHDV